MKKLRKSVVTLGFILLELSAVNIVGQDPPLGMVSSLCNQDHVNDIPPTLLVCFPAFFFGLESS